LCLLFFQDIFIAAEGIKFNWQALNLNMNLNKEKYMSKHIVTVNNKNKAT